MTPRSNWKSSVHDDTEQWSTHGSQEHGVGVPTHRSAFRNWVRTWESGGRGRWYPGLRPHWPETDVRNSWTEAGREESLHSPLAAPRSRCWEESRDKLRAGVGTLIGSEPSRQREESRQKQEQPWEGSCLVKRRARASGLHRGGLQSPDGSQEGSVLWRLWMSAKPPPDLIGTGM